MLKLADKDNAVQQIEVLYILMHFTIFCVETTNK